MLDCDKIDTVIFDIGNVLIFFDHTLMWSQVAAVLGVPPTEIENLLVSEGYGMRYERGELTTNDVMSRLESFNSHTDRAALKKALAEIFKPNEALFPLVHALKDKNKRLLLLSNIGELHHEYLFEKYKIFELFDEAILSYQVKALKPETAIFEEALSLADCPPERCFYTDDIPEYTAKAEIFGIQSHTFTSADDLFIIE